METEETIPHQVDAVVSENIPALCLKSYNPYTYCPLAFKHEDDMILAYVNSLAVEIRRLNGLSMSISGNDARAIDRYCSEITAYMNGRIHELVKRLKDESR
jgi:hypothetical protein